MDMAAVCTRVVAARRCMSVCDTKRESRLSKRVCVCVCGIGPVLASIGPQAEYDPPTLHPVPH